METLRRTARNYPLTCFVVAAYALSWWSAPFADGAIIPYGPFVAAVLVLALGLTSLYSKADLRAALPKGAPLHALLFGAVLPIAPQAGSLDPTPPAETHGSKDAR